MTPEKDGSLGVERIPVFASGRGGGTRSRNGRDDACLYLNTWPVVLDWKPLWHICHRAGDGVLCWFCMYNQKATKTTLRLKSRRSRRIDLNVSVVVHRPPKEGPQFHESTRTLVVSAHGALVALKGMVAPKQRLFLQNTSSGEQQECRVVSVNKDPTGPPTVAVEFTKPAPSFWRVAFPPSDWSTSA